MTDKYKQCETLLKAMEFSDDGMGWMPLSKDEVGTVLSALTLATESEQLRKERDELANGFKYMDALHKELGIVDLTKETARCREIAKKVTENGNG